MISVAAASAAPHHFEPLPGRHPLSALLLAADVLQQQRRLHAERGRQGDHGFQTRRHMTGLEAAQHAGADSGRRGHIRQGQALAFPHPASDRAELPADIGHRGSLRVCRSPRRVLG
jgi:hypothetical protein